MQSEKVVIFGPFVGEFGWELLFWQGWVLKACRETYRDYHKVAISYPGREPFYPAVDRFIPLPEDFLDLGVSARNYICDGWADGFPGSAISYRWKIGAVMKQILRKSRPHRTAIEKKWHGPSIGPIVENLTKQFREQFPSDLEVEVISPWKVNQVDDFTFGWHDPGKPELFSLSSNVLRIPFEKQDLEKIRPNYPSAFTLERSILRAAVFPRKRGFRRDDKNWSEENYLKLIRNLQELGYEVGILGDTKGAYFVNNPPPGVIDLVNVDDSGRLNSHIHFLSQSSLAVGAMSGATLMSLAAGTPTVIFGYANEQLRYHYENYLNTPLFYIADMNPTVIEVMDSIHKLKAYMNFVREPSSM